MGIYFLDGQTWYITHYKGHYLKLYEIKRNTEFLVLGLISDRIECNLYQKSIERVWMLDSI